MYESNTKTLVLLREILWIIKQLTKSVKPLFSDQKKSSVKITLVEGDNSFTRYANYAKLLNTFFSNVVEN